MWNRIFFLAVITVKFSFKTAPQQQRLSMRVHQAAASNIQSPQQQQQQPQQQQQQMHSPVPASPTSPVSVGGAQQGLPTNAEQQRQMKLKQLLMEKEMLIKRQEELNRQVIHE